MNIKSKLWNATYAHILAGFFPAGIAGVFLDTPWPVIVAASLGLLREIGQQFNFPKPHEKQSIQQILNDTAEFTFGGAIAEILVGFLK